MGSAPVSIRPPASGWLPEDPTKTVTTTPPDGPGLWVEGAGSKEMNGWYRLDPSAAQSERWVRFTGGRPWYQKDDGCSLFYKAASKAWYCCASDGRPKYCVRSETALPPARGWENRGGKSRG